MGSKALRETFANGKQLGPGGLARMIANRRPEVGSQIQAVAPSQESIRAAMQVGRCPFCGDTKYRNLALHTNLSHGYSARDLRALAGYSAHRPVCDPELSELFRSINGGKRPVDAWHASSAAAEATAAARIARFKELGGDWRALQMLAEEEGLKPKVVRAFLKKRGVPVPNGLKDSPSRGRPGPRPPAPKSRCAMDGCQRDAVCRQMCKLHYQRARKATGGFTVSPDEAGLRFMANGRAWPIGAHGNISTALVRDNPPRFRSQARYRSADGQIKHISVLGESASAAERNLLLRIDEQMGEAR